MSSKSNYLSSRVGSHGYDDIGALQLTGAIASVANHKGKALITDTAHGLIKGSPIVIAGTTSYNGPQRVIRTYGLDKFLIDAPYVASETGTWAQTGGKGAWIGFIPMDADLAVDVMTTLTFFHPSKNTGDMTQPKYVVGQLYMFPGVIRTIAISAGNLRLVRNATLNPQK